MTYTRRLTVALRSRGADEDLITDVVRETESLSLDDDGLEQELGQPEEYAQSLVPQPAKKRVGPVVAVGLGLAALWVAAALTGPTWGWESREALGPLLLWPAVGFVALGILGQFTSDYFRRPGHDTRGPSSG